MRIADEGGGGIKTPKLTKIREQLHIYQKATFYLQKKMSSAHMDS